MPELPAKLLIDADPPQAVSLGEQLLAELKAIRAAVEVGQQPEALSPAAAAAFLGISTGKLHNLNARGMVPEPVQIGDGRLPRWSRGELICWLRAGAPPRNRWVLIRLQELKRAG